MISGYTEDHLVEQPAIQLMQHKLGWDLVNCYGEWDGGTSNLGRDGKREVVLTGRLKPALQRLNPDLPVDHSSPTILRQGYERHGLRMAGAIEPFFAKATKVKEVEEICRDRTALSLADANREIDSLRRPGGRDLFASEPERQCNWLRMNEFLFDLKTSVAVSSLGETGRLSEIPIRKLIKSLFSRKREN